MHTGKSPLAMLIDEARRDRSVREVARTGGIAESTLAYYYGNRWPAIRLPAPEVMQAIADGLRVPLARVQKACLDSLQDGKGREIPDIPETALTTPQAMVLTVMDGMTIAQQEVIYDVVLRLGDAFGVLPDPIPSNLTHC